MRLKKGFTLAEILIVLMVLGAIATMTIPSLIAGVRENQWKTAYKKAYNNVVNLASMNTVTGSLSTSAASAPLDFYKILANSLSVKAFSAVENSGTIVLANQYKSCANLNTNAFKTGTGTDCAAGTLGTTFEGAAGAPWIISDDNLAYTVVKGGDSCGKKADINSATTLPNAASKSCAIVVVDVNGLSEGPNILEPQVASFNGSTSVATLTGDRYYVYVGTDGATAGAASGTITGRIVTNIK